ncbi:nucleoside phosphatase family-domain-containing protein [Tribonema minus]|uniref:Nucleoside phosphatase family-domain-containing protein n=1 Tax=Tribonema minus TaxID=303371 RepID=A0A835YRC7_9STRA|nr:nucleoside phosphatase family-domain-containing protein [Tribonema minus]
MADSRRLALAATALLVTGTVFAIAYSDRGRRLLSRAWSGDVEGRNRRKDLQRVRRAATVIDDITAEIDTIQIDMNKLLERIAAASKEQRPRNSGGAKQQQQQQQGVDRGDSGLKSSYYHFASDGTRLPSKWDNFDTEAELRRLDQEESAAEDKAAAGIRSIRGSINKKLSAVTADIEAVQAYLDTTIQARGDDSVRAARKAETNRILGLSDQARAILVAALFAKATVVATTSRLFDYAIVVDAGSGGSRLYVYHVHEDEALKLRVTATPGQSVTPGLSTFAGKPEDAAAYLSPLFQHAMAEVPPEQHSRTPVFIKGTAGMRLVEEPSQLQVYDALYEALAVDAVFPFHVHRRNLDTIDGASEAYYAVLATNYLEGRVDARLKPTAHPAGVLGALDMGGASTQIIFPPAGPQSDPAAGGGSADGANCSGASQALVPALSDDALQLTPAHFWARSHLSYGVAEVRARVWRRLVARAQQQRGGGDGGGGARRRRRRGVIANPCAHAGHAETFEGHALEGAGDAHACAALVREVLWGGAEEGGAACPPRGGEGEGGGGCPVDGVAMPPVAGDFYAMSVFFYGLDCVRQLGPAPLAAWPRPSLAELTAAVDAFCGVPWGELAAAGGAAGGGAAQRHRYTSKRGLAYRCVESVYMVTLLRDAYGFPEHGRNITFALEANGMEVEWTLGYMLAEVLNGDAAAHITPILDHLQEDLDGVVGGLGHRAAAAAAAARRAAAAARAWLRASARALPPPPDAATALYTLVTALAYAALAAYAVGSRRRGGSESGGTRERLLHGAAAAAPASGSGKALSTAAGSSGGDARERRLPSAAAAMVAAHSEATLLTKRRL